MSFTAKGLPPGAGVSFSPATIAVEGGAQAVTVQTAAASASAKKGSPFTSGGAPLALALMLWPCAGLRRVHRQMMLALMAVISLAGLAALSGCGSSGFNGQAVKDYTVTITGTSGQVSHSFDVNLNLQ